jgi:hypothetical protein
MANSSDDRWTGRSREVFLTKDDFLYLNEFLTEKYPDLFCFERSRSHNRFHIYDSILETDRAVGLAEFPPQRLPRQTFKRRPKPSRKFPLSIDVGRTVTIPLGEIETVDLSDVEPWEHIRPIDFIGWRISPGTMMGTHKRSEKEAQRFINGVFRLVEKFMTNSYDIYNLETGKLVETLDGCFHWSGRSVIRLGREHRDFYSFVVFYKELGTWCGGKAIPKKR